MSKEPIHPLARFMLGKKLDSEEIEMLEQGLGPLRGRRALLTLAAVVLPCIVAGILIGFFQAWSFVALAFVVSFVFIVCRALLRTKF